MRPYGTQTLDYSHRQAAIDSERSRLQEFESLILAQNERWRRASDMQVERESTSVRVKWRTGE